MPVVPRAIGTAQIAVKARAGSSVIDTFRTSGSLKVLWPRSATRLDGIVINTAGGVTGGDRMDLRATVGKGAHLGLTTQAAERAYRADNGTARVTTEVTVGEWAALSWLPQELILFDGAALDRRLRVDMADSARLLLVEPVVLGRAAMREKLRDVAFHDRITVNRGGLPLYRDAIRLTGDVQALMARQALGQGAGAMALVLYVAPDAEAHLTPVRALLPATGGATLLQRDVLVVRMLAPDSFELRRALLPVLDRLSEDTLPTS
ncbi:MAG: urease accessory protein UreD [Octadecabacter sp.]|nr:urease accessory protein UreD [Octadecabacter sp.]